MDLILASLSLYRRALLERLGVPFRCAAPRVDEAAWKARRLSPRMLAEQLAEAKATSLRDEFPGATIIGCDQVATIDGVVVGKPGVTETANAQLAALSGRAHELITALVVAHGERLMRHTDVSRLTMRRLTSHEIARYVQADQPLDCAGAYKLESRGIALFEQIDTADCTAITGLPLIALTTILRTLGFSVP